VDGKTYELGNNNFAEVKTTKLIQNICVNRTCQKMYISPERGHFIKVVFENGSAVVQFDFEKNDIAGPIVYRMKEKQSRK
jgi:hypothetical protein